MVWGDDTAGQLPDERPKNLRAIAGGSVNGLALLRDGTPVLWGQVLELEPDSWLGLDPIPAELAAGKFRAIAIGRDDAVLIRPGGKLEAFGRSAPIKSVPAGSYRAAAVAAVHAVAIAGNGTLEAWGSDTYNVSESITLAGLLNAPAGGPFKEIDASVLYSLALHDDGTLYGWGHPAYGINVLQGWTATPEDAAIFYRPGETFAAIAAGNVHALAIRPNGTVTGWGDATTGALQAPTHVRFKAVAAGWGFSIGLDTDGTLWGWGTPVKPQFAAEAWTFDSQGWTRFGNTEHYYVPQKRFRLIAAAAFHIMAVTHGH